MSLIEGIQVARDIVIILSAVTIATVAVIVGRAVLDLSRKAEDLRVFVGDVATGVANGVANPVRGVAFVISRLVRHRRRAHPEIREGVER